MSLSKGDRVQLIERDDDFGDGWYLGRHLMNGSSGLFPEVYTRLAPRGPPAYMPSNVTSKSQTNNVDGPLDSPILPPAQTSVQESASSAATAVTPEPTQNTEADVLTSPSDSLAKSPTLADSQPPSATITTPLVNLTTQELERAMSLSNNAQSKPTQPLSVSMSSAAKSQAHGQDSPVMNETLSVIEEHITDMNSPHHSVVERRAVNDSGSEYSSHLDHRLSYINGEETDEEEDALHTLQEVTAWTSDQVAEYLFTAGVEKKHCEVFRDQEITGDVLMGMDQTSLFLKEFDLGSVGRRLKTWQKIKTLQDEANGETTSRRNTATYGSEIGSDDVGRHRSRSTTSSVQPKSFSMSERSESAHQHTTRRSQQQASKNEAPINITPMSPKTQQGSPRVPENRPSAASIRDLHHSRQSSATEYGSLFSSTLLSSLPAEGSSLSSSPDTTHKKQPSFDRNWTMGSAAPPSVPIRPLSANFKDITSTGLTEQFPQSTIPSTNLEVLDRGYFSGGEAEGRPKNVLRKRGSTTTTHSRNSSYTDEQRLRSATAHSRHSRFGSVDSIRDSPPSASQKYYGLAVNGRRRTPSENSVNMPRPAPPPKDPSPVVTRLEGSPYESIASPTSPKSPGTRPAGHPSDWLLPVKPAVSYRHHFGLRAISDAVTGHEKSRAAPPNEPMPSPRKESPLQSPSRTTSSSTPSGGPSFELDSPDAKSAASPMTTPGSKANSKRKTKKETSAYTRGLLKKTPQEQMVGADYSGWMKKKSTNLMTTWKPRLFILRGRRLSYYYSENDEQEKGLIDISFHRVLPADGDRLTGLHATLTGATNSPTSPLGASTATIASSEADAEPESTLSKGSGDSMFIFKLVPPRTGLSQAINFTKPTVHYFAVPNIKQGRLWMAALMKATIDRDDSKPITTTYQQKTISLAKARQMRHRPPALMNLDEHIEEESIKTPSSDKQGLNIQGITFDREMHEGDSAVSGLSKNDGNLHPESAKGTNSNFGTSPEMDVPLTA